MDLQGTTRPLNRSNRAAVDAFNKIVSIFNEAQKAFNVSVSTFNTSCGEDQMLMHAYNTNCAGRPFFKADEDATRNELGFSENPMKVIRSR